MSNVSVRPPPLAESLSRGSSQISLYRRRCMRCEILGPAVSMEDQRRGDAGEVIDAPQAFSESLMVCFDGSTTNGIAFSLHFFTIFRA